MCVLWVLRPTCTTHAEGNGDINMNFKAFGTMKSCRK